MREESNNNKKMKKMMDVDRTQEENIEKEEEGKRKWKKKERGKRVEERKKKRKGNEKKGREKEIIKKKIPHTFTSAFKTHTQDQDSKLALLRILSKHHVFPTCVTTTRGVFWVVTSQDRDVDTICNQPWHEHHGP